MGSSKIAPASMWRVRNEPSNTAISVFSLGKENCKYDRARECRLMTGIVVVHMQWLTEGDAVVGICDQIVALPKNTLSLPAARVMQDIEKRC